MTSNVSLKKSLKVQQPSSNPPSILFAGPIHSTDLPPIRTDPLRHTRKRYGLIHIIHRPRKRTRVRPRMIMARKLARRLRRPRQQRRLSKPLDKPRAAATDGSIRSSRGQGKRRRRRGRVHGGRTARKLTGFLDEWQIHPAPDGTWGCPGSSDFSWVFGAENLLFKSSVLSFVVGGHQLEIVVFSGANRRLSKPLDVVERSGPNIGARVLVSHDGHEKGQEISECCIRGHS